MRYVSFGLTLLLLFSTFSATAFGTTHKSLCTPAAGLFVCGTTRDPPFKTTPEPFYASTVDIIHPQPGQFANYSMQFYYPSPGYGWWNTSYNEFVQPHVINTTHIVEHPYVNGTYWCTVDKTNRLVTDAHPDFWDWNQTGYILWIETNVTVGSTINWWTTNATIVGSQILHLAGRHIDCWIANASYHEYQYDLSYYDKISGLAVAVQSYSQGERYLDATLNATNIPIGKWMTLVLFNINPNPATPGQTIILLGVVIFTSPPPPPANEPVELYVRPIGGSWRHLTSLTTEVHGIFIWRATIPVKATGTFIFAVYYPGSETYESSYNFAILIIQ